MKQFGDKKVESYLMKQAVLFYSTGTQQSCQYIIIPGRCSKLIRAALMGILRCGLIITMILSFLVENTLIQIPVDLIGQFHTRTLQTSSVLVYHYSSLCE